MTNSADNSRTPRGFPDPHSELLSRAYRDAVESAAAEPGQSVDDAIRAAAHDAVEIPSSREADRLRAVFRGWCAPLALAATLLLAVAIALRVYQAGDVKIVPPSAPATNQNVKAESGAQEKTKKTQPITVEERKADKALGAPPSRDASRSNGESPTLQPKIAETGVSGKEDAAPAVGFAADKVERERSAENAAARAPQVEMEPERQETQPLAKPFPGAAGTLQVPPPAHQPAATPRASIPGRPGETSEPKQSPPPASLRGGTAAAKLEKAVTAPPAPVQLLVQRLEGHPPQAWIEEIRGLKRAGRSAEATELLEALRKKFPNFTLPDDLK
ncbi:MAG: hypothetical protein ACM3TN_17330 [Alphaproteobacteria bacterium]